jgi:hypothetical protein
LKDRQAFEKSLALDKAGKGPDKTNDLALKPPEIKL